MLTVEKYFNSYFDNPQDLTAFKLKYKVDMYTLNGHDSVTVYEANGGLYLGTEAPCLISALSLGRILIGFNFNDEVVEVVLKSLPSKPIYLTEMKP